MKLLMTTDTSGGVWSYSTLLCEELSKAGNSIVLLVCGITVTAGQLAKINRLEKRGVKVYYKHLKSEWMEDSEADVIETGKWIRQIYLIESPDILHFNNYGQVAQGWDVPVILVAHSCVASWWKAVKGTPLPPRYVGYFRMVQEAFEHADVVVSPTFAIKNIYQQLYGAKANQVVIPNGIPMTNLTTTKRKLVFSAGRIEDEGKNISLLIDAADQIKADVFIAGSSEKEIPKKKNVTYLGELTRTQVSHWMRMAMLYVVPAKYEPFGLSFLEAGSHATSLIGGKIETLAEIWGDSMSYVDPNDPDELAAKCNELLSDSSLALSQSKKARQRSQSFSLKKMAQTYQQLYASLLQVEYPQTV